MGQVLPDIVSFNASLSACEKLQQWSQASDPDQMFCFFVTFLSIMYSIHTSFCIVYSLNYSNTVYTLPISHINLECGANRRSKFLFWGKVVHKFQCLPLFPMTTPWYQCSSRYRLRHRVVKVQHAMVALLSFTLQCGAPQLQVGLWTPLTIDISPINHSYWSYVHQLSQRTGAPPCTAPLTTPWLGFPRETGGCYRERSWTCFSWCP